MSYCVLRSRRKGYRPMAVVLVRQGGQLAFCALLLFVVTFRTAHASFLVATDCPLFNAYAPEIGRIVSEFEKNGIAFCLIYAIQIGSHK